MAHKFDRSRHDPYGEAARRVEEEVFSSNQGIVAGAEGQVHDALGNAIVDALGDIAARAYRFGLSDPKQMERLARAVSRITGSVFDAYAGEVDPEPALTAIESNDRIARLTPVDKQQLEREIARTRLLEKSLLEARRISDLVDLAESFGLEVDDTILDRGAVLVGQHPTPATGNQ